MNFFNRESGGHSRRDGKSRRPPWPVVFVWLPGIVVFGYQAAVENDYASREQTSVGNISLCERRGKGNENYCLYTFPVGSELYAGGSVAERDVGPRQTATVYYDSKNPRMNTLEDFSEQGRKSMRIVYLNLLALAATVAFLFLRQDAVTSNDRR